MNSQTLPTAALPGITGTQKLLVQTTFAQVAPIADQAAAMFYDRLFQIDPDLRIMFKEDMTEQRRMLMETLALAVAGLDAPDELVPVVQELGRRHKGYGVSDTDYDTVGTALLWTLEQGLGAGFTDEVRDAWTAVYGLLAGVMKSAAADA